MASNVLQELEWRGFVQQSTPGLAAHFAKGPVTAYCGFDPTVRSLQVGNLMPLMLLANLQRHGHRPIVLMGGGTGLIGDPSGKSAERPLLSREEIRENVRRLRDQSARFLEFGTGPAAAFLLDNAKWLVEQHLIDFLRDVGKHFTVNVMMQKESVKARMDSGLSFTEFSYMLLQAYDFLHLYRERQCTLQVAGSDQWGNITAGIELIRRVENAEAHGLVAPLVTRASGQKFGKTESGAVYLDPEMTSPYKFYQFWVNVDDRDVESYLKLFTLQSRSDIDALLAEQKRHPAARRARQIQERSPPEHRARRHLRQSAADQRRRAHDQLPGLDWGQESSAAQREKGIRAFETSRLISVHRSLRIGSRGQTRRPAHGSRHAVHRSDAGRPAVADLLAARLGTRARRPRPESLSHALAR